MLELEQWYLLLAQKKLRKSILDAKFHGSDLWVVEYNLAFDLQSLLHIDEILIKY